MSDTEVHEVSIDGNTADFLDVADRAVGALAKIVEARYASELLDAIEETRKDFENEHLEDARLACRSVADAWNDARTPL